MYRRVVYCLAIVSLTLLLRFGFQSVPSSKGHIHPRLQHVFLNNEQDHSAEVTSFTVPLRTSGRDIVDDNGRKVKLASVNWYGASSGTFAPLGLDIQHRTEIAATIRAMGFNSVRFSYSDQLVIENPIVDSAYLTANLDLLDGLNATEGLGEEVFGPRALDVFNACVKAMTDAGIAVIINNHVTRAHRREWVNLCDASWKNDQYGPICKTKQTTQSWIDNWKTVMELFVDNPLVIGADLRHQPKGFWGTMTWDKWATAAEKASEALLKMQPNWLMFVEGILSANDCSGARLRPVKLSVPDRVVYSSHVQRWSGWSNLVSYRRRRYPLFAMDMERNWGYLLLEDIAPVWVGQFGIKHQSDAFDLNYWNHLIRYLQDTDADWAYSALHSSKPGKPIGNAQGLLMQNGRMPMNDFRLEDLKALIRTRSDFHTGKGV